MKLLLSKAYKDECWRWQTVCTIDLLTAKQSRNVVDLVLFLCRNEIISYQKDRVIEK